MSALIHFKNGILENITSDESLYDVFAGTFVDDSSVTVEDLNFIFNNDTEIQLLSIDGEYFGNGYASFFPNVASVIPIVIQSATKAPATTTVGEFIADMIIAGRESDSQHNTGGKVVLRHWREDTTLFTLSEKDILPSRETMAHDIDTAFGKAVAQSTNI